VVIDGSFLTRTVEFISNHLEGHLVGLTLELPENKLGGGGDVGKIQTERPTRPARPGDLSLYGTGIDHGKEQPDNFTKINLLARQNYPIVMEQPIDIFQ
jgi:hypothetical protein